MKGADAIIASVDLISGSVVRLQQGDYARQTQYSVNPLEQLSRYVKDGARRLHIVDLDGARDPSLRQTELISALVRQLNVPVQTGGGVRCEDDVRSLLEVGVARVIVGSLAVKDPKTVKAWFKTFSAAIIWCWHWIAELMIWGGQWLRRTLGKNNRSLPSKIRSRFIASAD